jgi:hypothetical protein
MPLSYNTKPEFKITDFAIASQGVSELGLGEGTNAENDKLIT